METTSELSGKSAYLMRTWIGMRRRILACVIGGMTGAIVGSPVVGFAGFDFADIEELRMGLLRLVTLAPEVNEADD